jgi:hypothetical protein
MAGRSSFTESWLRPAIRTCNPLWVMANELFNHGGWPFLPLAKLERVMSQKNKINFLSLKAHDLMNAQNDMQE